MRVVDLTHLITPDMSVFPGDPTPERRALSTVEEDGYGVTGLFLGSHTGTHMDAPAHVLAGGDTLDRRGAADFIGPAAVLDCSGLPAGARMDESLVTPVLPRLRGAAFVLIYTGWDRFWGKKSYFEDYPVAEQSFFEALIRMGALGIGLDTPSPDPPSSRVLPNHRLILESGLLLVENLKGLGGLRDRRVTFCALPLHFEGADGAPVRAVALI